MCAPANAFFWVIFFGPLFSGRLFSLVRFSFWGRFFSLVRFSFVRFFWRRSFLLLFLLLFWLFFSAGLFCLLCGLRRGRWRWLVCGFLLFCRCCRFLAGRVSSRAWLFLPSSVQLLNILPYCDFFGSVELL